MAKSVSTDDKPIQPSPEQAECDAIIEFSRSLCREGKIREAFDTLMEGFRQHPSMADGRNPLVVADRLLEAHYPPGTTEQHVCEALGIPYTPPTDLDLKIPVMPWRIRLALFMARVVAVVPFGLRHPIAFAHAFLGMAVTIWNLFRFGSAPLPVPMEAPYVTGFPHTHPDPTPGPVPLTGDVFGGASF